MATGPGRRERKKLESRDRIVECAIALFTAHGYQATTMEDIGECADVSRATVFNYFARKEDLVLEWFDRRRADLAKVLDSSGHDAGDTSTRLRDAFCALARFFEDDPRTGRAMVRAWLQAGGPLLTPDSDTSRLLADTIRAGQARGDVADDADADRAGIVLFDVYSGELYRWVSDDGSEPLENNLLRALDLVLNGITTAAATRS